MSRCPVPLSAHDVGEHELDLQRAGFGTPLYCGNCNRYLHPEDCPGGVPREERGNA